MADGRREEWRRMLVGQAWAIGTLFGESTSEAQFEQFVRFGTPGDPVDMREPRNPAVDSKVAEILRTGKLIVE